MLVSRPRFRLLAGFQVLAGLAILPFLFSNPHAQNVPAGLCAVGWLLLAGTGWLAGPRLPPAAFEVSLYLSAGLVAAHAALTPRPPMQVLDGLELLILGLFAAFALPAPRAQAWLIFGSASYMLALFVNSLPIGAWLGPVIVVMVASTTITVSRLVQQIHEVSRRDALTGALNRSGLADQSDLLRAVAQRSGTALSVVFVDLDGFKSYNDSHGHQAGDDLLSDVVEALHRNLRSSDLVARVGGDEFVVVMAGVDMTQADQVMERISDRLPIAVTFGSVDWPAERDLADAIDRADQAMYRRKRRSHSAAPDKP